MWSLALFLAFSSFVVSQIQIVPLTLGTQRRDTVNEFKWKFYSFTAAAGSGFTMTVIHDDQYDLDLYIRKGAQVPDRFSNYDYKDSGMDSNLTIVGRVESVATLYTAGVFCFRGNNVNFSIIVTSGNGCINSCSGHGACVRGACVCNEGYSGESCDTRSQELVPGGAELGPFTLATGKWSYFRFSVQTTESLQIAVTQTTRGDIDTYVQYGSLPSLTSYRFANLESYDSLHPTHFINMTAPDIGEWIVGCYAFEAASFRIKLIAQRGCPDNCSGAVHGTCIGARCSCSRNYFGTFCESYRPNILLGLNYTGEVGRGAWNYYKISAGSLNQLVIQMSHLTNEDCDLYVNENSNPTKTNYTYRDISSLTNAKITIPQAGNTLHYVGIFGYRGCHYTLSASLDSPNSTCTNNCVHGTCINGVCQCQSGYSGVRCDQTDTTLVNGETTQGTVSLGKWAYYNYTFRDTSQVFMIVKETSSSGMMHMYFAFNQPPTLSTYIMKEIGISNMHRVAVQFSQRTRDFITNNSLTFIVGIYGTTSIPGGRSLPFKIVCWSPPF